MLQWVKIHPCVRTCIQIKDICCVFHANPMAPDDMVMQGTRKSAAKFCHNIVTSLLKGLSTLREKFSIYRDPYWVLHWKWNVMLMEFSWPAASEVVKMTTSCATNHDNFMKIIINITTFHFSIFYQVLQCAKTKPNPNKVFLIPTDWKPLMYSYFNTTNGYIFTIQQKE